MLFLPFTAAADPIVPSFATQTISYGAMSANSIVAVDVNGDGKADLIVADELGSSVAILLNVTPPNGLAPAFTPFTISVDDQPSMAIAADLNGDGKPDLILASYLESSIDVLVGGTALGSTNLSFGSVQRFGTTRAPSGIAAVDLNGDGKLDLVVTNPDTASISLFLNTTMTGSSTLTFAAPQTFAVGATPLTIVVADLNRDGKPDLVISGDEDWILINTTPAGTSTVTFASQALPFANANGSVAIADVNGDGIPDLLFESGIVVINTTAADALQPTLTVQPPILSVAQSVGPLLVADIDGDGKNDLVVADQMVSDFGLPGESISIYLNAGGSATPGEVQFSAELQVPLGVTVIGPVAVADFNGDGKQDIAVATTDGTTASVTVLTNRSGAFNLDQHGLTGSWYDAARSGQGFEIEVYPDLSEPGQGFFSAGWFTYDATPNSTARRWYVLAGDINSNSTATFTIYAAYGGNLAAPPVVSAGTPIGYGTIEFSDCDTATLTYFFTDGSGNYDVLPLTRIAPNVTCSAAGDNGSTPSTYLFSGNWYDPSASGQGFIFDFTPSIGNLFAAWYTFAPNGEQIGGPPSQDWFTLQAGGFVPGTTSLDNVPIYATTGELLGSYPPASSTQVGTANVRIENCEAMTLTFSFTSGANEGLAGTIPLQRVGPTPKGCTLQ